MEGQEQGTMAGNGNEANTSGPRDGEKLSLLTSLELCKKLLFRTSQPARHANKYFFFFLLKCVSWVSWHLPQKEV